jgi:DNA-binding MarR family transcriptional regulator
MSYANDMTKATLANSELSSALRISVMRLARRLRQQRAESGLGLTYLSAMATIDRHGQLTPGELAALERVQPPSMTRVLARLDELGLVARRSHPTDRRQMLVSLTDAARAVLREDRRRREAWLVEHLAALSPQDRDVLAAAAPVLERLAGAV